MLRKVQITDKNSDNIIAELPIILKVADAQNKDYLNEAWKNAIDNGLVDPGTRSDYRIEFVDEISG